MKIIEKDISFSAVIFNPKVRLLCKLPYPNHPKGCPNYGIKKDCPPKAKFFHSILMPPFTLVGVRFNLKEHIEKMRQKHPEWTYRQLKCLLYWQNHVNKLLSEVCEKILSSKGNDFTSVYSPEATGIDVFVTCKNIGIRLVRHPRKYVWKVAIIGKKR